MTDNQAWQGAVTAFQAAAKTPPETQEDEARPLPSNGVSRCYIPENYLKVVNVHAFLLMIKLPICACQCFQLQEGPSPGKHMNACRFLNAMSLHATAADACFHACAGSL